MKKTTKSTLLFITFGVVLFAISMHASSALQFVKNIIGLIFPIILGLIMAFVLNVPMTGLERRLTKLFAKAKHKPKGSLMRGLSLLLTLAGIVLVIALAITMVIPALVESAKSVYPLIEEKLPEWMAVMESYQVDMTLLSEWMETLDFEKLSGSAGNLLGSAVKVATTTISSVTSIAFGFVIAVYILLSKNVLSVQAKKILYAHLKKKNADRLCYIAKLVRDTYTKFLSGQCMEAIILGCLIFLAYSIFGLPYAGLIGFLTSLFAFVPYIGGVFGMFYRAFLALLAEPSKVLLCIIVYLVVQFIENQFIYPQVVGTSVGLSPLWTLIAALIGGKLFGLPGIIFFIPFFAVLYTLVREDTNKKLEEKGLSTTEFSKEG